MRALVALLLMTMMARADGVAFPGQPPQLGVTGAAMSYSGSGGSSSCSESIALRARMDGAENTSAVDVLICGMVMDATYSLLDGLYVFATNSATNAQLNWAQNAYNLTLNGTETFAANAGYTGDASTGYFDTGFNPSTAGGQFQRNAATIGGCALNTRSATNSGTLLGVTNGSTGTSYSVILPFEGSVVIYDVNGSALPSASETNSQGSYTAIRSSSSATALYRNGNATPIASSGSDTSADLVNKNMLIGGAYYDANVLFFSNDQIAYVFYGNTMTTTQMTAIYNRLHTYLAAVGAPSGC